MAGSSKTFEDSECVVHTGPDHPERQDCVRYKLTKADQQKADYMREALEKEEQDIFDAVNEVTAELRDAVFDFPPMPTFHDGHGVIREELDELWDEVKASKPPAWFGSDVPYAFTEQNERLRNEAKQVAAMAIRFMLDLTHPIQKNWGA